MSLLGKQGVTPDMVFTCIDCGDTFTGDDVLQGCALHIVPVIHNNPHFSEFRCEGCAEELTN